MQAWRNRSSDVRKLGYGRRFFWVELNRRGWSHGGKGGSLLWFVEVSCTSVITVVWDEWEEELNAGREDEGCTSALWNEKNEDRQGRGQGRGQKRAEKKAGKKVFLIGTEQTKRDNAIRMLRKGFGTADVSECVDLPEEEVRRLAEER